MFRDSHLVSGNTVYHSLSMGGCARAMRLEKLVEIEEKMVPQDQALGLNAGDLIMHPADR